MNKELSVKGFVKAPVMHIDGNCYRITVTLALPSIFVDSEDQA
jgi:hypothetical protein